MAIPFKRRLRPLLTCIALCVATAAVPGFGASVTAQHDLDAVGPVRSQCHFYRNNPRFDTCHHGLFADEAAIALHRDASVRLILVDTSATVDERAGVEVNRAQNAWAYLVNEKGISPDRVVLRWNRVSRQSNGRWGGSMRILVIRTGERLPDFVEGDVAWQLEPLKLAPN